jgi:ubiquinone/menaquinone biosynthesis C-methylase UbiE
MGDDAVATKRQWGQIFDRAEPTYDRFASSYFTHFGPRLAARAAPTPGSRILDVACGKGAVLLAAMDHAGPTGFGLGVDISPAMVGAVRRIAADRSIRNVASAVMDAEGLAVADATFDVVLSAFSLHFLPDPERGAAEFRRALRPGGTVGISEWGADDARWAWESDLLSSAQRSARKLADGAGTSGPRVTRHFEAASDVVSLLEGAGFSGLRIDSEEWTINLADVDEWWAWKWSFGFRRHLDAMDDDTRRTFKRAAAEAMRPYATPEGYPLTLRANFVTGRT